MLIVSPKASSASTPPVIENGTAIRIRSESAKFSNYSESTRYINTEAIQKMIIV